MSLYWGWRLTIQMGRDLQCSSWDSTSRCTGPNCCPQIGIHYVFGVPEEISSDGGPEFSLAATADFLTRWQVRHRMSSAYFLQSNCRADVAVKKAKRMLLDNVGPTGTLNNDGLLRALLQARNTPDPDISPAQMVFGRPIRDAFSFISRCSKYNNPSICIDKAFLLYCRDYMFFFYIEQLCFIQPCH